MSSLPGILALAALLPGFAFADTAPTGTAKETDPISEYLADLSPGATAANEMIGVSASAVTTLSAPKDFTATVEGLSSGDNKAAFGLSFTPGRTRYAPVSIANYRSQWYSRLWAGTTFSYAQNTLTQSGTDYREQAVALHLAFYIDKESDPSIAAYDAFANCAPLKALLLDKVERITQWNKAHLNDTAAILKGPPPLTADEAKAEQAKFDAAHDACLASAQDAAKPKWNASQFGVTLGQSWVRETTGTHLVLGKTAAAAVSYGFGDSLVNLTVRRLNDSLDVTTLAAKPSYSSSTLAGLRYTLKPATTRGVYALAEISNAKGSTAGQPNDVFKAAFGADYRLRDGIWLQFRVGRNHKADGSSMQTTTLFGIKMSPQSTLPID